ncbi:hypothetical protein ABZ863_33170, partial [Saccharomonospora sp. NPDC046836]|uniref:hypothetical protein n=1 Tax=Saccharomonospora sp. NPDC046836 TaxID=3156921 RepID=UPI00340B0F91
MVTPPMSRRNLLRLAGLTGVSLGTASLLTGCGGRRPADGSIVAAMNHDGPWIDYLRESGRQFETDNPGSRIEVTTQPVGQIDAWLVARTVANQAPDIVEMGLNIHSR